MIKEHKINGNNINIIPLGTDINRFRPDVVNRLQVRKVLNVPENDTLIIYTGKIVQTKDPALIIEACSDLFYNQNIKLLFVGNVGREYAYRFGKLKEAYQKYIIHIEAVPNSEISKYYQASDIGVWPKEASMSSVDAMSCGLPIIICDYLSERLKNENGIGIKEADLKSLKKALEKLVIDKKLCIQMGKNGRMLAEEEYSWKSIAQKFLNLADI
jgi:glycosyltransferase involved in cell wall biosynthesis